MATGAVEAANVFALAGISIFAVTTLAEAIELRNGGIDHDILIYAPIPYPSKQQ